jgi:DNA-binding NarL/FixJ family response regulator
LDVIGKLPQYEWRRSLNRILLCEKNKHFKEAILRLLRYRFPDLDIKLVLSSKECLAASKEFKPDIMMLGVDIYSGAYELDILQHLRENQPDVNVILFTEYTIDEYRKEAILRGANHIISKDSWTGNEILALVKTILVSHKRENDRQVELSTIDDSLLERPLELRRKDAKGKAIERNYLATNPDRRKQNAI